MVIGEDPSPELLALKERALALLNGGIAHKREDGVSSSLVQAELSLVANYLEAGEFDQAIELLNDPKTGPRTLAEQGSGLVEGMERRTYLFAIQAYIGALSTSKDPAQTLANAMASMDALKEQLVGVPNGEQALIAEYVKLAQALQSQIVAAPPQTRNAISQGYEKLLERVANSTDNPTTLAWTAESLGKLGAAMTDPGGAISTRGQSLVRRATELYDQVLKMDGVSEQLRTILRLRVAIGKRDAGEHKEAIDEFVKLLSDNEMQVHVQMEAAKTYQQWGESGDNTAYKKAIMGDHPIAVKGGKNLVWGWGKLTQVLSGNPKYRELFHECRYNLAQCRYQYAMQSGKTEKGKALQIAKNEIVLMSRFYPELGGPQRKEQYDALLKKIQRAIGEKPTGLKKN